MLKTTSFWKWFQDNLILFNNPDIAPRIYLIDSMIEKIGIISPHLGVEIYQGDPMELVITADSEERYFHEAEEFVKNAPEIKGWKIMAHRPPRNLHTFENLHETSLIKSLWFRLIDINTKQNLVGIQIGLESIPDTLETEMTVHSLIQYAVGEKVYVKEIHYIEFIELPPNHENDGFMPIENLADFLKSKKK